MPYCDNGIRIFPEADSIPSDVELAVYSLALDGDDATVRALSERGTPLISRAQMLGALMNGYPYRVSVSGSHGKSTTTAAIEHILSFANIPHTAISGTRLSSGVDFVDGGEVFVAEACEYKDSFLSLSPNYQIITSVELDHTDYFSSFSDIQASFMRAAESADTVIINADCDGANGIANEILSHTRVEKTAKNGTKRVLTYGKSALASCRITDVYTKVDRIYFSLVCDTYRIDTSTPLIGKYNLYNLAAAAVLCSELDVPPKIIGGAIESFTGIERRMSLVAKIGVTPVFYDYAHHPAEIRAAITALNERFGSTTVIFRPHTYSRTASLWQDFVSSLSLAEMVILLDVYPAREEPMEGIDSRRLASQIKSAVYSSFSDAASLAASSGSGAIALLGAGDVRAVLSDLIEISNRTDNS